MTNSTGAGTAGASQPAPPTWLWARPAGDRTRAGPKGQAGSQGASGRKGLGTRRGRAPSPPPLSTSQSSERSMYFHEGEKTPHVQISPFLCRPPASAHTSAHLARDQTPAPACYPIPFAITAPPQAPSCSHMPLYHPHLWPGSPPCTPQGQMQLRAGPPGSAGLSTTQSPKRGTAVGPWPGSPHPQWASRPGSALHMRWCKHISPTREHPDTDTHPTPMFSPF